MFLHIGNSRTVREKSIIGIFDVDKTTVSPVMRAFLKSAETEGRVETAKEEIPKSFVLYKEKDEFHICFSQLSPTVLSGRMDAVLDMDVRNKEEDI